MRFLWCALLVLLAAPLKAEDSALLSELSLKLDEKQTLPLGQRINFNVAVSRPVKLAKSLSQWSNIKVEKQGDNSLNISIDRTSSYMESPIEKYSNSSFVIDIEEQSTKHFISSFPEVDANNWQPDELSAYVNGYIDDVTYIHGFNIASVVAAQRSGDCTEHAVLVTALARGLGLPARVVVGTVIIEEDSHVSAYGHAWSEVWHDGQWYLLDAALYDLKDSHRFYLPASALENEGPGYAMSLAMATSLLPFNITELRSASQ